MYGSAYECVRTRLVNSAPAWTSRLPHFIAVSVPLEIACAFILSTPILHPASPQEHPLFSDFRGSASMARRVLSGINVREVA